MHFEIPALSTIVRHALPRVVEGTLIPLALFLLTLRLLGTWGAVTVGLVWIYLAVGVRLVMRKRVPGVLLIAAATMTARTVVAFASGSVVVYFLQPSLGTMLVATAFLLSVPLGRPLAGRLAADFCPLPDDVRTNIHVIRFFRQISLLWAFAQTLNATLTVWLLFTQSLGTFVVARYAVSWSVTIGAIVASTLWFRTSMARQGILVVLPTWRGTGSQGGTASAAGAAVGPHVAP